MARETTKFDKSMEKVGMLKHRLLWEKEEERPIHQISAGFQNES